MISKFRWFSILVGLAGFAIIGTIAFWPSSATQSVEAAKCIEDPEGRKEFRVALNSVIDDKGYLVVNHNPKTTLNDSRDPGNLNETQPPLHWNYPSIRLSWDAYPGAKYRLRRHDAKSAKAYIGGDPQEVYGQRANEAEEWSTATTADRPNHASAMRFWYIDIMVDGEIKDAAQLFWVEVRCGQTTSSSQHMRAQFLTEPMDPDPAPAELAYPRGTYVSNVMWNPRVEAILAERRAAAAPQHAQGPTSTPEPVPATIEPTPTREPAATPTPEPTTVPATPEPAATPTPEPTQEPAATPEPTIAPAPVLVKLTAEFRNVPTTHNGIDSFTMELHFSEDVPELGYKTIRDSALRVENGRITKAKRHAKGSNQAWTITVRPASRQAVEIELPATADCTATGAICVDERMMSGTPLLRIVSTQVDPANMPTTSELTAEFRSVDKQNGRNPFTMELHFSEDIPGLSYKTIRDSSLMVDNGRVTRVQRMTKGSNQAWVITIHPTAQGLVKVGLPAKADCNDAGAICVDGRMMSGIPLMRILLK